MRWISERLVSCADRIHLLHPAGDIEKTGLEDQNALPINPLWAVATPSSSTISVSQR